ncbi:MAG: hypothetical protein JSW11_17325 [Candidatus Heimdallarchaeota archaeon]|nr:MAG: hypothetical protein JSW11_17325 [Candidatus Heimdallarchaeota archaeon]
MSRHYFFLKVIVVFLLAGLISSFIINPVSGLYYETKVKKGERIVYKRHDYNYSSQSWESWSYLMYEIVSFKDHSFNGMTETTIEAKRWTSKDSTHWIQIPFQNYDIDVNSPEKSSPIGVIAHLTKIPIKFSVTIDSEDLIIRSGIKIEDFLDEIESMIETLSEGDDELRINPINDGYGINLIVVRCGCAIEGGVGKSVRNITYNSRGVLQSFYFDDKTNFGPDSEAVETKYEQFLVEDIEFNKTTFENLSISGGDVSLTTLSDPEVTPYSAVFTLFSLLIIIISRRRLYST